MSVTAVVVAGGRRSGVDTLTTVGGVPMVVRAVRAVLASGLVDHVVLLDAEPRWDAVLSACSGLPVSMRDGIRHALFPGSPHAGQRADTAVGDGLVTARSADVVLLHDAARPLAPSELAAAVVATVHAGHDVAVAVLPLTDTVKRIDGAGIVRATPDRAGLCVVQTPQAFRRDLLSAEPAADPLAAAGVLAAAGAVVRTVPGHPMAFAVRSSWDLELAELLVRSEP